MEAVESGDELELEDLGVVSDSYQNGAVTDNEDGNVSLLLLHSSIYWADQFYFFQMLSPPLHPTVVGVTLLIAAVP